MEAIDFTNDQEKSLLFAFYDLDGNKGGALINKWDERFKNDRFAFLNSVDSVDNTIQFIEEKAATIPELSHLIDNGITFAFFLDYSAPNKPEIDMPFEFCNKIRQELQWVRINTVFHFGYAGSLKQEERSCARANAECFAEKYKNALDVHRLFLTEEQSYQRETLWKGEIAFLDCVCRNPGQNYLFPYDAAAPDRVVGFIGYEEYRHDLYQQYENEVDELTWKTGNSGKTEFGNAVNTLCQELVEKARRKYSIDGSLQPKCIPEQSKKMRCDRKQRNEAKHRVEENNEKALMATKARLESDIESFFDSVLPKGQNGAEMLCKMMDKAKLSYSHRYDADQMKKILCGAQSLKEEADSNNPEGAILEDAKRKAISKGEKKYRDYLSAVYSQMDREAWSPNSIIQLQQILQNKQGWKNVYSIDAALNQVKKSKYKNSFMNAGGDGADYRIIISDSANKDMCLKCFENEKGISVFCNQNEGTIDNAPMKSCIVVLMRIGQKENVDGIESLLGN